MEPSPEALRRVVRRALQHGVPAHDAEDLAAMAWERAAARFQADRGTFDAFFERVGRTAIADWWRRHRRRAEVKLVSDPPDRPSSERLERVHANQQRLLEALSDDERAVFETWALQKHLPQGHLTAPRAAASLGLTVEAYNLAKRRLQTRIRTLAEAWGFAPRDFFSVDDHEGPRRRNHVHG